MSRLAWVSALTFVFTIPHSIEDFTFGIAQRFGFTDLTAATGLGIAMTAQVWSTAALSSRPRLARILLLLLGLVWVIGALADHTADLFSLNWRSGVPSKALVVGIIVSQGLVALLAANALLRNRADSSARG
jgi:hypothetical protein